jgi:hypothetical protein
MTSLTEMLSAEFGKDFEDIAAALPHHPVEEYTRRALTDIEFLVLHHTEAMRLVTWASEYIPRLDDGAARLRCLRSLSRIQR